MITIKVGIKHNYFVKKIHFKILSLKFEMNKFLVNLYKINLRIYIKLFIKE